MELLSQAIHVRLPSTRVQFTGTRDALKEGGIKKENTYETAGGAGYEIFTHL